MSTASVLAPPVVDRDDGATNDGMKRRFRRTRMARLGIERIAITGATATRVRRAGRASIAARTKRRWWFMVEVALQSIALWLWNGRRAGNVMAMRWVVVEVR